MVIKQAINKWFALRQQVRSWCRNAAWWPSIYFERKGVLVGNMKFIGSLAKETVGFDWSGYPSGVPFAMVMKFVNKEDPVIVTNVTTLIGGPVTRYLLAHEHGHIACGHMEYIGTGLLSDNKVELEADAAAATLIGSSATLLGLSLLTLMLVFNGAGGDYSPLVVRINALKRLAAEERKQERSARNLNRLLLRNARMDNRLAA